MGIIGSAVWQVAPKWPPGFWFFFNCYGCRFIWTEFHWDLCPPIFGHNNLFLGSVNNEGALKLSKTVTTTLISIIFLYYFGLSLVITENFPNIFWLLKYVILNFSNFRQYNFNLQVKKVPKYKYLDPKVQCNKKIYLSFNRWWQYKINPISIHTVILEYFNIKE